jgi:hypothetical protein
MVVHLWDLKTVSVKLKLDLHSLIKNRMKSYRLTKRKLYNLAKIEDYSFFSFSNILKYKYFKNNFIPLRLIMKIMDMLKINKDKIYDYIISYKTSNGINNISSPKLPFSRNVFTSILFAHHIGDGTPIRPKDRLPYFGYRQFDGIYRNSYITKLKSAFGEINFKKGYSDNSTRPYCPASCSEALCKIYGVTFSDSLSKKARIPKLLFNSSKEEKISFLIGLIIDDGYVDSTDIVIGLKNKKLVADLKILCSDLDYDCCITFNKEYGYLYILREGMEKLYDDFLELNGKYPEIDLGYKGDQMRHSFLIKERKIIRTKGNKEIILKLMENKSLTVNEIAKLIKMTRQGVRYHIKNLLKDDKICIVSKFNENNYIYGVKNAYRNSRES